MSVEEAVEHKKDVILEMAEVVARVADEHAIDAASDPIVDDVVPEIVSEADPVSESMDEPKAIEVAVAEIESEPVLEQEDPIEEIPVAKKKGRPARAKKAAPEPVPTKRGRAARKAVVKEVTPVAETQPSPELEVVSPPDTKPEAMDEVIAELKTVIEADVEKEVSEIPAKKEPEVVAEVVTDAVEVPKKRGRPARGKKQVNPVAESATKAVEPEPIIVPVIEARPIITPMVEAEAVVDAEPVVEAVPVVEAEPIVEVPKKKGRPGRGKKTTAEEPAAIAVPSGEPLSEAEQPTRKGRVVRSKRNVPVIEPEVASVDVKPAEVETEEATTTEIIAEPTKKSKAARDRKAIQVEVTEPLVPTEVVATAEESIVEPVLARRGRRGKASIPEVVAPEPASELAPARRGRATRGKKTVQEPAVESELELVVEPVVEPVVENIVELEAESKAEHVPEPKVVEAPKKRGRAARGKKTVEENVTPEPMAEPVPIDEPVMTLNKRSRKAVKDDPAAEAEQTEETVAEPTEVLEKRAGRGRKAVMKDIVPEAVEPAVAEEKEEEDPKRRGRATREKKEETAVTEPEAPKRRGRAARSTEEEAEPVARKRKGKASQVIEEPVKTGRAKRGVAGESSDVEVQVKSSVRGKKLAKIDSLDDPGLDDLPSFLLQEVLPEEDIIVPKASRSKRGKAAKEVEEARVTFSESVDVAIAEPADLTETSTPARSSRRTRNNSEDVIAPVVTPSRSSKRTPRKVVSEDAEDVVETAVTPSRASKRSRKVKEVEEKPARQSRRVKTDIKEDLRVEEEELRVAETMLREIDEKRLKRGAVKEEEVPSKRPKRGASLKAEPTKPPAKSKAAAKSKAPVKAKAKAKKVLEIEDEVETVRRLSIIVEESESALKQKRSTRRKR